ncbi:MAG: TRL-like family protein [Deltaproteobacteria bacterium]|nr:TRL-like family protein [Deltaproteobacteria bacterium]
MLLVFLLLSGCATVVPVGALLSEGKIGHSVASGDATYTKIGTAKMVSVLGLVARGDASIAAAAKSVGITRIKFVDYEFNNILGIYGEYTTVVYGD